MTDGFLKNYLRYALLVFAFLLVVYSVLFTIKYRKTKAYEKLLTPEQKNRLESAKTISGSSQSRGFYTEGLISKMVEKNEKYFLHIMFYNRSMKGKKGPQMSLIEIASNKDEVEQHRLKVGDYVWFYTNKYEPQEVKVTASTVLSGPIGAFGQGLSQGIKNQKSYLVFNMQ